MHAQASSHRAPARKLAARPIRNRRAAAECGSDASHVRSCRRIRPWPPPSLNDSSTRSCSVTQGATSTSMSAAFASYHPRPGLSTTTRYRPGGTTARNGTDSHSRTIRPSAPRTLADRSSYARFESSSITPGRSGSGRADHSGGEIDRHHAQPVVSARAAAPAHNKPPSRGLHALIRGIVRWVRAAGRTSTSAHASDRIRR